MKKSIQDVLGFVSNKRVGVGSIIPLRPNSSLSEAVSNSLLNQWENSGRDKSKVFASITESDGTEHFLTGWDGNDTFVGYTPNRGLGYISASRVLVAELDPFWNPETTLDEIRQNLTEMDSSQVSDLVGRLKKCLTKRSKGRRPSEVKNFVKRFQKAMSKSSMSEATEATEKKPKKKSSDALMHTPGQGMQQMKSESFIAALGRFRKLSEGDKDDALVALKKEIEAVKESENKTKTSKQPVDQRNVDVNFMTPSTPEDKENSNG